MEIDADWGSCSMEKEEYEGYFGGGERTGFVFLWGKKKTRAFLSSQCELVSLRVVSSIRVKKSESSATYHNQHATRQLIGATSTRLWLKDKILND